jgi:hypothetical protein
MEQAAPPGWYADPHGNPQLQRYWDGNRWTEHVHDAAAPAAPAAAPAATPGPGPQETPAWQQPQPQPQQQPSQPQPQPQPVQPFTQQQPTPQASNEARQWAMAAHLSALVTAWFALGFIGPLIVYVLKKDDHPFIRQQAAEALNFNLSMLIYALVGGFVLIVGLLLIVGIVLIPVAIAAALAWLILIVVASVKASKGEPYRYPLTIRFVD